MNPNEPNTEPEAEPQEGGLPSTDLLCPEDYPRGSKWYTANGILITVNYCYIEKGVIRLVYSMEIGGGGHMGKNHIERLIKA